MMSDDGLVSHWTLSSYHSGDSTHIPAFSGERLVVLTVIGSRESAPNEPIIVNSAMIITNPTTLTAQPVRQPLLQPGELPELFRPPDVCEYTGGGVV